MNHIGFALPNAGITRTHRASAAIARSELTIFANPCHFEIDANYRLATLPDVHTLSYADVFTWMIASHLGEKFPQKTCRKNAVRQSYGLNPRFRDKIEPP
jgi:hypothetical protein